MRANICAIALAALALATAPPTHADSGSGSGGSSGGGFDIPTGGARSPLFGALPWTQPLLRFEEFGAQQLPGAACVNCAPLPAPANCQSSPQGAALDTFLRQPLYPAATREANVALPNYWATQISACVRPLASSVVEGRPPGEYFAHQRWNEFAPRVYFQSAQAGARRNNGLRDPLQRHGYALGEFGPGGLYHGAGTTAGIDIRFHPAMPLQAPNSIWTFDGTLPPKLLMARHGEPVLFRHFNALPIDFAANGGFGAHTITTHHHNGHNPGESDGFTGAFFFPGQFYDYRWPLALAGYDTINTDASDPHAAYPDGAGGAVNIRGDWRETMSTNWFHDHMLDFTAPNVYKGNAAMMNIYSAVDRGREGFQCNYADPDNVNLCLPSGSALDWGNRDYDVDLVIADKAWNAQGQLWFNIFNLDGFLGDQVLVNWVWRPYMEVRARRYRLRLLNGAVSRNFLFALVTAGGTRVPFHMIANDGNIMEHAIRFPNAESQDLPEQTIAERYDIVVDFSQFAPGTKLYLVNLLEHKDGRGPNEVIPLADVLNGRYSGDPAVGKVMEFRVQAYGGVDRSMDPALYEPGGRTMIPLPRPPADVMHTAIRRDFEFGRSGGTDHAPWTIKVNGGEGLTADPHRVSAAPTLNSWEIWRVHSPGGWQHPVHVHFEEAQIISHDGGPPLLWERYARKDMFRIGDNPTGHGAREMELLIRFREFLGTFVEHCHNTQHEDHAMLLRWDARAPGQVVAIPTPIPDWEGVFYEPSYDLKDERSGNGRGPQYVASSEPTAPAPQPLAPATPVAATPQPSAGSSRTTIIGGGVAGEEARSPEERLRRAQRDARRRTAP